MYATVIRYDRVKDCCRLKLCVFVCACVCVCVLAIEMAQGEVGERFVRASAERPRYARVASGTVRLESRGDGSFWYWCLCSEAGTHALASGRGQGVDETVTLAALQPLCSRAAVCARFRVRSIKAVFTDHVTRRGFKVYEYTVPDYVFFDHLKYPPNAAFCTPDVDHCLGSGVLNISVCKQGTARRKHAHHVCASLQLIWRRVPAGSTCVAFPPNALSFWAAWPCG